MATKITKETLLQSRSFTDAAKALYSVDVSEAAERFARLASGMENPRLFSSPGRAELVGNHTDHNHGYVVAGSIDLDVACAVEKTDDGVIVIESEGFEPFENRVDDLPVDETLFGTTKALLRGVLKGFLDRGYKVGGFRAKANSNIFKGAGVSSSAAFELLLCEILNALYNDDKIDFIEKAIISRFAENVYFGKPSGLMDQLTISGGGVRFMNFSTEIPTTESADWAFDDLSLVIINCGGDHCNLTDEYASIRTEMESVASYFRKKVLGEVSPSRFYKKMPSLKGVFPGRAILRAKHFFDENKRVLKTKKAVETKNKKAFLRLINESGLSSYTLLQNCFPTGDVEQPIPFALAVVSADKDTLAHRVHGGGFAGTILAFVDTEKSRSYVERMKDVFGKENVFGVKIRKKGAVEIKL